MIQLPLYKSEEGREERITCACFHVADSFAFLRAAQDRDVDVVITDPPFPDHVQENMCSGSLLGKKSVPKYDLEFPPLTREQLVQGFGDLLRVAKRWVVFFCAVESFGHLKDAFPEEYVRGTFWAKKNAMGQLTADRPASAYEGIAWLHRSDAKKAWNGHGSYGLWAAEDVAVEAMYETNGTRGKKGRHSNEKPVDLCMKLVALASNRGETVFDPWCGSAAIGEACVRLGRNYIGLDRDREWVERAKERIRIAHTLPPVTDEEALAMCKMWDRPAALRRRDQAK